MNYKYDIINIIILFNFNLKKMFENAFNYLSEKNNISISFCSSQTKGCNAKNILSENPKSIWLSDKNVPQTIIINLSSMAKSPSNYFKYFGIFCWHAYSTNPKIIQVSFSENNNKYYVIGEFELSMSPSPQFFQFDNITIKKNIKKIKYLKLIVKETFGGNRTYINQIFLYDDKVDINHNFSLSNYEENLEESEKEDDDNKVFKPITPSKEVKKYNIYSKKNKNENVKNLKKNSDLDLLDDEMKEKKLKKIEKILKSKILNNITVKNEKETINQESNINKYITPENEYNYEEEEEKLKSPKINLNDYLSDENSKFQSISSHQRNKIYNVSNLMTGNQTESEDPFKTNNFNSHTTTYSTYNNKRNLTPIPKSSKPFFRSPIINDNNSNKSKNEKKIKNKYDINKGNNNNNENNDYKRLEDQLKEMEDQLKLLEPNYDMGKNLSHSKSYNFLPKESNSKRIESKLNNPFVNLNNNNKTNYNNVNTQSIKKEESINQNSNKDVIENLNSLNTNRVVISEERINIIENKINNLENDIFEMKNQFNKISNDIQILISMKESHNNNNNNNTDSSQLIQIVLNECEKLINLKFSEFNYQINSHQYSNRISHDYYPNYNTISLDSDLNSLEIRLNKKIDERLNILANNIQNQINDNLLVPSIRNIENTMKNNMNEIKDRLTQLNLNSNNNNFNQSEGTSFVDSYRVSKSLFTSQNELRSSSLKRNEKLEEINKLGEKLYDKLVEKEKKLQEFKNETTNYFKRKLKNDERKFTNSINSLNSQSNNIN